LAQARAAQGGGYRRGVGHGGSPLPATVPPDPMVIGTVRA